MILLPVGLFVVLLSCRIYRLSTSRWISKEGLVAIDKEVRLDGVGTLATIPLTGRVLIVQLFRLELAEHIHAVFAEKLC